MGPIGNLTEQVRGWYEHSPTAQRAYATLRTDVTTMSERARPMLQDFWDRIGPLIDPPAKAVPDENPDPKSTDGEGQP